MDRDIFSILNALNDDFSDMLFPEPRFLLLRRMKNRETCLMPGSPNEESFMSPDMDILEDEKKYTLKFNIPGVKKEDLKVTVNGNTLEVKASVKKEITEKGNRHYTERYYGNYYRSLEIPETIDKNSMNVSYTNGVLEINVGKKELPKPEIKELPIA